MNTMLSALKDNATHTLTENGGASYNTTCDKLLDLFALGGSYRSRSTADVVNLFMNAFREDEDYAMKCLFYLRDVRGGKLVA